MKKLLLSLALLAFVFNITTFYAFSEEQKQSPSSNDSLKILIDGNNRFVSGKMEHSHQTIERVKEISNNDNPFAIVIACTDSRIVPEIIFDQGLGDIIVIRSGGNIITDELIGNIEWGVEDLKVPLVMVLGHERCGAVDKSVNNYVGTKHRNLVFDAIKPAVEKVQNFTGDKVDKAAKTHVELVVDKLKTSQPVLEKYIKEGKLKVVGAYYDLDTGKVEIINP